MRLLGKMRAFFTLERLVHGGLFIVTAAVFFALGYFAPRETLYESQPEPEESSIVESEPILNEPMTGKIAINSATKEELMSVPGIGETYAQRIIDYREENGRFRDLTELMDISGIGEKRYNQWKEYFTLD